MQLKLSIIAILAIIFLLLETINAYQYYCYSCTNCNDPFVTSKANLVLCSNGCYKNVNKQATGSVIERGCSTASSGCTNYIYGPLSFGLYNYCCWGNYCNSSTKLDMRSSKLLFILVSSSLIALFKRLF